MNASVTHIFWTACDRCREIHPDTIEVGNGCYCPDCLDAIAQDNAEPRTIAAALDGKTYEVAARLARRGN